MADQAGSAPGWNTGRPPVHGYYLGAWQRGTPPAWTVSELWFNPDSTGSGWWSSRGYLDDRMSWTSVAVDVAAWMPVPVYPGDAGHLPGSACEAYARDDSLGAPAEGQSP